MDLNNYPVVYLNDNASPGFLTISKEKMGNYGCTFIEVVQKDSPGKSFGFSLAMQRVRCFDLDRAAASLGGNNPSTMDCLIRIGAYCAVTKKFSSPRWLMVELKLNTKEAPIDRGALAKKVKDTECGLAGEDVDISRNFIYPEGLYAQKRSAFANWKRGSDAKTYKNWHCYSPAKFEKFLLFQENLPYKPENEFEQIRNSIYENGDSPEDFDTSLRDWKSRAETYLYEGNRAEYLHILHSLNLLFKDYINGVKEQDDKEYLSEEWKFLEKY